MTRMSPDNPAAHMRRPPASGSRPLASAYRSASTGRWRAEGLHDHPVVIARVTEPGGRGGGAGVVVPVAARPRLIPAIGLVGAPLILASTTGTIFGAWYHSTMGAAWALPIAVWEFSLGVCAGQTA